MGMEIMRDSRHRETKILEPKNTVTKIKRNYSPLERLSKLPGLWLNDHMKTGARLRLLKTRSRHTDLTWGKGKHYYYG